MVRRCKPLIEKLLTFGIGVTGSKRVESFDFSREYTSLSAIDKRRFTPTKTRVRCCIMSVVPDVPPMRVRQSRGEEIALRFPVHAGATA